MDLSITQASEEQRGVVDRLLQLCLHDYSAYEESPIGEDGRFDYRWLDQYWLSPHRTPYLLRSGGQLAGFALIRQGDGTCDWQWQIGEFFILHGFRGRGLGSQAAETLLRSRAGWWEVAYCVANEPARRFWRRMAQSFDAAATPLPAGEGRQRYLIQVAAGMDHGGA